MNSFISCSVRQTLRNVRPPVYSITRSLDFSGTKSRLIHVENRRIYKRRDNILANLVIFNLFRRTIVTKRNASIPSADAVAIQKQVSALTFKKPLRKKAENLIDRSKHEAVAYAVSEEIKLEEFAKALANQELYKKIALPTDVVDGMYVKAIYEIENSNREIFFFREGAVVFWNMSHIERKEVLQFVRKFSVSPYDMTLCLNENECIDYAYTADQKTNLVGDIIQLNENEESDILLKYTFSNALALSVKLAIWEESLDQFVETIEPVIEDLRFGKKIRVTRDGMLQMTGELFTLRHLINLSSDLLDTPDFYWDREGLEPLYQKTITYLNITRRTKVINEKLKHCCELTELLSSHLNDKHHTRLEVMIIVLIFVEVMFEIGHYIERYCT